MKYFWDKTARVYRDKNGKAVSNRQVKLWLLALLSNVADAFRSRCDKYLSDDINFDEWFTEMQSDINALHRSGGAMAYGGFANMQNADHADIEQYLQIQLAYFRTFATQVYHETPTDAQLKARAAAYAFAGYSTYENSVARREHLAGMLIYKRNIKAGNNCNDCIEIAKLGWRFIGQLPAIGTNCACRSNCRCYFTFSNDLTLLKNDK